MRNIEIKAKVKDINDLLSKINDLQTNHETIHQEDIFYKSEKGRLKLRKTQENAQLIFYERPDDEGPKVSDYEIFNIPKDNVTALNSVLTRALDTIGVVKKTRQLYICGQTRIHVDHVDDLGDFLEFEVVLQPNQSIEDGHKIANNLMKLLKIDKKDLISCAYIDLLIGKNLKK